MKQVFCKTCGAPIVCTLKRSDLYFYIEDGKVIRDTNPDFWEDDPFLLHCSEDIEHPVSYTSEWREEFETEIAKVLTEAKKSI